MKKFLFVLLISISGFANAQCPIIPTPKDYLPIQGFYTLPDTLTINAPEMMPESYSYLEKELAMHSIVLKRVDKSADLSFAEIFEVAELGYQINIDDNIVVSRRSQEGTFYAINSLLQMIVDKDDKKAMKKCFVNDAPRFGWRGLHLDVSRHFFSVEEVKHFIDLMALYKFNKFHWHLTDDQGWRIEIKKYPKLTSVGGFRDSTVIGHFSDSPRKYDTEAYGGFYTQEDVKEVVAYAASKFIDVVPEIEMPGHSRAALAAYPEYSCNGELQEVPGLWGIFDDIYCSKTESIDFMKDILSEVLDLFPSEYIHIGGDEAPKVRWKECNDCQKVIKDNKLKDEHELQSYFIRQIDEFLTAKNRKLIGWDEILEGGLSPNAAVMSWRGESGGIEAAKQGHYVVMSPTTYCYFDYYQSSHDIEPLAIGGYLPLEKVYRYNPVPKELTEEQQKYILGGQANLWTEYMGTMDHVEYMAFPRALALIQSLWCVSKPKYEDFLEVYLAYHEDYLGRHDANFAKSIHYPELKITRAENGIDIQFYSINEDEEFELRIDNHYKKMNVTSSPATKHLSKESFFVSRDKDRNNGNEIRYSHYTLTSKKYEETLGYVFNITEDLGRSIELITPPHPKYDHNGSLNLVDGIVGGERFKGTDWLGFRENVIEMVIDTRDVDSIKGLLIGFKENNGSWIYLPKELKVLTSDDGVEWVKVGDRTSFRDGENSVYFPNVKANYIKLEILSLDEIPAGKGGAGSAPWTFIDEIELIRK